MDDEMCDDTTDVFYELAKARANSSSGSSGSSAAVAALFRQLLQARTASFSKEAVRQQSDDLDDDDGVDEEMEEEEDAGKEEESNKNQCDFCSEDPFHTSVALRRHVRSVHPHQCLWTCITCGAVFPDLEQYKQHLVKVTLID